MNDASIKSFVNELNLKCPHCGGSVKINHITGNEIFIDHFMNISEQKIASNLPKCKVFDTDVTSLVVSFKNNLMQLPTLRDSLVKIAAVKTEPGPPVKADPGEETLEAW